MNPMNFMKGIVQSAYVGSLKEAKQAASHLDRISGTVLTSSEKINAATNSYMNKKIIGGAKKGAGEFIENRRDMIFDKRMADPTASGWATDMLMADGVKGKVGSLLFSGETGALSKTRIAGVGAGIGAGGYMVFGGDDR